MSLLRAGLLTVSLALPACGGLNASQGSDDMDADAPMEVSRLGSVSPEPVQVNAERSDDPGDQRPPRPTISSTPFRLVDLPLAAIPAMPDEGHAPKSSNIRGAAGAPDLVVEHTSSDAVDVRVKTADRAIARLQIGGVESTSWDGLRVKCGIRRRTAAPARWEVLERLPKGRARYTVVNAWFDAAACRAAVIDRTSVELFPVVDWLLYAYRECEKTCDTHQTVTLVGPALKQVTANAVGSVARTTLQPFGKVTMELERGSGSSLTARIGAQTLDPWFGGQRPGWAKGSDDVFLGVDVVQAVEEAEPVAVAYVGRTPPATVSTPIPNEPVDIDE